MVVERDPPFARTDLNETQLRMLKECEIPGLLPMEIEECDGQVSLRYLLSGTRMLSEAMRSTRWSMAEMAGAICKLAEAMEECRLYLLDADRIRLHDEFIFVGEHWHDLKFVYLPIDVPSMHRPDDLERLIVRWMTRVSEPDGQALQQVLRLVASEGFTPSVLSRYAKQYLAETAGGSKAAPRNIPVSFSPVVTPVTQHKPNPPKPSRPWDLLQPESGDLQPVSELWGDDREPLSVNSNGGIHADSGKRDGNGLGTVDIGRWRIVVACIAVIAIAFSWKFIYLGHPSQQMLLFCLCLTLIVGAVALMLWNGPPNRKKAERDVMPDDPNIREIEEAFQSHSHARHDHNYERSEYPRFPALRRSEAREEAPGLHDRDRNSEETSWISSSHDQTALLDQGQSSKQQAYYLVWKTEGNSRRIPLQGNSLVIGRSSDAAQHVDEAAGISRAHLEFVRVSEQWKVKDLGSRNGTRLNDKSMAPYELYALQRGDCLTLARSQYQFQQEEG